MMGLGALGKTLRRRAMVLLMMTLSGRPSMCMEYWAARMQVGRVVKDGMENKEWECCLPCLRTRQEKLAAAGKESAPPSPMSSKPWAWVCTMRRHH